MAGDWIKMRNNLWDDPRVSRLCDLTDATEASVIGALYWLWATADQHSEDGCMPGLTLRQIDRKTGISGFAAALVAIDWLHDDPQGVVVTRFEEHNGSSAKKRCQTARRVASYRDGNADVTQDALQEDETCVTGALAREEKRREEEIQEEPTALVDGTAYRPPPTPTAEIVELYHRHLPALPAVEVLNDARKRAVAARWREVCAADRFSKAAALDWFGWFFERVSQSDFLMGRSPGKSGRTWAANFDFLFTPTKFVRVVEGAYHQGANQ
jgi:hypothetical protein